MRTDTPRTMHIIMLMCAHEHVRIAHSSIHTNVVLHVEQGDRAYIMSHKTNYVMHIYRHTCAARQTSRERKRKDEFTFFLSLFGCVSISLIYLDCLTRTLFCPLISFLHFNISTSPVHLH